MKLLRRNLRLVPLVAALGIMFAAPLRAETLLEMYESARAYDATWQSAKAQYDANLYRAEQARAGILPAAGLGASVAALAIRQHPACAGDANFTAQSATISASQPLYRPANFATYQQGKRQIELAEAQLTAASQDLIIRVSQAYFDVLAAQDTLGVVQALKAAVGEQLASAKRNFEVGTTTITDTREAQARYDLAIAQEIAADNDLRVKKLALDVLVGKTDAKPNPLATPIDVSNPAITDMNLWVQQGEDNSPAIQQARSAVDVAQLETEKARAGHKPTLDLTASYNYTNNPNGTPQQLVLPATTPPPLACCSTCRFSRALPPRTASAKRCHWKKRPRPTWKARAAPLRRPFAPPSLAWCRARGR